MPWLPELFSAPVLQQVLDRRRVDALAAVPYFDGLLSGEPDALVESFAGEPVLYDPVRGRVRGERAFRAFVADRSEWLARRNVRVDDVEHVVLEGAGFEEAVMHVEGGVALPFALVADRRADGRIEELRAYHSNRPLLGRHGCRAPLHQPASELRPPAAVAAHQRALAAGDAEAVVATFEPDGYAREPSGAARVHTGPDALRAYYERLFSHGGGLIQEHCRVVGDERVCAVEYNLVGWGAAELLPQAGIAVYVRGRSGEKLAAVRVYDDVEPPGAADSLIALTPPPG